MRENLGCSYITTIFMFWTDRLPSKSLWPSQFHCNIYYHVMHCKKFRPLAGLWSFDRTNPLWGLGKVHTGVRTRWKKSQAKPTGYCTGVIVWLQFCLCHKNISILALTFFLHIFWTRIITFALSVKDKLFNL